jgi:hypothetical protein
MFGFGDAVCVPVIEWIDQQVLSPIYQTGNRIGAAEEALAM